MKVSLDYPDELDEKILREAEDDGHTNRAAAIRKMIFFYLSQKSQIVAFTAWKNQQQNTEPNPSTL